VSSMPLRQRAASPLGETMSHHQLRRGADAQDFRNGESGVGIDVHGREIARRPSGARTSLRRSAYVGAVDFGTALQGHYQVSARSTWPRRRNRSGHCLTQTGPGALYQRPGAGVSFDSTAPASRATPRAPVRARWAAALPDSRRATCVAPRAFEANDLVSSCRRTTELEHLVRLQALHPSSIYQQAFGTLTGGNTGRRQALPSSARPNQWPCHAEEQRWVHGASPRGQPGTTFCDRNCFAWGTRRAGGSVCRPVARGGRRRTPCRSSHTSGSTTGRGDGGRSERFNGNVQVTTVIASQVNTSLTLKATHNVNDVQP